MTRSATRRDGAPRLVVTDLDGTFLSPDGTVSATNAEAVRRAEQAGLPVLFATGRPVRWLDVIGDLPGAHPTVIASNGAVLYDLGTREVRDSVPIPVEVAAAAARRIRAAVPGAVFGFEAGDHFGHEEAYLEHADLAARDDPAVRAGLLDDLVAAGPYVKVLVRHPTLTADELSTAVTAAVGDTLTVTHSSASNRGLAELSAPGVSKATMLARCCDTLGVDAADVAAFGDMPNDRDMLAWAGRGYVMADGHPALRELGATVVGSNADSGVGRTILGWLG